MDITRRTLTEGEHNAAWHAIEGAAGREGADPETILNAVLHALGINPPSAGEERSCPGFPEACPNPVTVAPAPPHHAGGIRCGCGTARHCYPVTPA
ncbi:hypothetical protein [Streptomyces murinus]|uniref:hypothetical protein n=1 Tax=Streptomyces murinus TaxID=33900 RepID=UPI002E134A61|nr:hypothetical protein OG516_19485 [Streptomyces murinus]